MLSSFQFICSFSISRIAFILNCGNETKKKNPKLENVFLLLFPSRLRVIYTLKQKSEKGKKDLLLKFHSIIHVTLCTVIVMILVDVCEFLKGYTLQMRTFFPFMWCELQPFIVSKMMLQSTKHDTGRISCSSFSFVGRQLQDFVTLLVPTCRVDCF